MLEIDNATFDAALKGIDINNILNRLHITGELLDYHARGEEAAVFPAVEKVAPLVARAYLLDHRELDIMVAGLEAMRTAPTALAVTRATAVLHAHLRIHLNKEDSHLYPILRERTTEDEQKSIVGIMASKIPPEKTPTLVQWLLPLLGHDDRAIVAKGWMTLMPPPVFAGIKPLMKETLPQDDWAELVRRIPELEWPHRDYPSIRQ